MVRPPGNPSAFKTCFGWVLVGVVHRRQQPEEAGTCCVSTAVNDLLKRFWKIEDCNVQQPVLSLDERTVVEHFHTSHSRDAEGRYIVPLPMKTDVTPLGESRSLAVRRFKALERWLRAKSNLAEIVVVTREYFDMGHAEPVCASDLERPCNEVYYVPMHGVRKESRTTSKVCVVFDTREKRVWKVVER